MTITTPVVRINVMQTGVSSDADVYVVIAGVVGQDDQARRTCGRPAARCGPQRGGRSTGQLADRDNAYEQGIRGIKGVEY
jgi:hypothetical protein